MRFLMILLCTAPLVTSTATAQAKLAASDQVSAFRAAGFTLKEGQWRGCDDPGTPGYVPGQIDTVSDLNGDGRPEAIVTESSTFCYGTTEVGYVLISRQLDGKWKRVASGPGVPTFLLAKSADGWPDLQVGGPGFCHPVERWNGREYVPHHHEYEGKPCQPQR